MEHFDILLSLIGILFVAVIGVYVWSIKMYIVITNRLAEVYEKINNHFQRADIHSKADGFVEVKVCNALHESLCRDIKEIKADVKELVKAERA